MYLLYVGGILINYLFWKITNSLLVALKGILVDMYINIRYVSSYFSRNEHFWQSRFSECVIPTLLQVHVSFRTTVFPCMLCLWCKVNLETWSVCVWLSGKFVRPSKQGITFYLFINFDKYAYSLWIKIYIHVCTFPLVLLRTYMYIYYNSYTIVTCTAQCTYIYDITANLTP